MWWWILAAIAAIGVAGLTLAAVLGWFSENSSDEVPLGDLMRVAAAEVNVVSDQTIRYEEIVLWFQAHNDTMKADKDNVAATVVKRVEDGSYRVIQVVFNKRTQLVVEGRVIEAEVLDESFEAVHEGNDLVLYE